MPHGEACGFLVVPSVFKTGEVEHLGLAGSIPVRLRRYLTARFGIPVINPFDR